MVGSFCTWASIFSHSVSWVFSVSRVRMSLVAFCSDCCTVSRVERRLSTLFAVRKSRRSFAILSTIRRCFSTFWWICDTALSQRTLFSSSVNLSIDLA